MRSIAEHRRSAHAVGAADGGMPGHETAGGKLVGLRARLKQVAAIVPGLVPALQLARRWSTPQLRSIERTRRRHGAALFQPFADTWDDRYPELFDALAARLAHIAEPRILSFGCSTGAEVRSLLRRLPGARIVGIDANARSIAIARRHAGDRGASYLVADRPPVGERFDAVLAMAVLRHGVLEARRPAVCTGVMPFAQFAGGIAMLDAALLPGGWLAIGHAHFRFTDTEVARRYRIDALEPPMLRPSLLYGADDRRLPPAERWPVLFHKRADAAPPGLTP